MDQTHFRHEPYIPNHRRHSHDIDEGDPSGARRPAEVFPPVGRHIWNRVSRALSLSHRNELSKRLRAGV